MVRKNIETFVEVDVDLDDFQSDELIDELEARGYIVMDKDDSDAPESIRNEIQKLKDDFINWYQFGMKNENFEKTMKQFFKETIGEYIV